MSLTNGIGKSNLTRIERAWTACSSFMRVLLVTCLISSCGEVPSGESTQERILRTTVDDAITHYGYMDGRRYEVRVDLQDLTLSDSLEAAMAPAEAALIARKGLEPFAKPSIEYVVCSAELIPHVHNPKAYYYLISFCEDGKQNARGFVVPVLLSGIAIEPTISAIENQ